MFIFFYTIQCVLKSHVFRFLFFISKILLFNARYVLAWHSYLFFFIHKAPKLLLFLADAKENIHWPIEKSTKTNIYMRIDMKEKRKQSENIITIQWIIFLFQKQKKKKRKQQLTTRRKYCSAYLVNWNIVQEFTIVVVTFCEMLRLPLNRSFFFSVCCLNAMKLTCVTCI